MHAQNGQQRHQILLGVAIIIRFFGYFSYETCPKCLFSILNYHWKPLRDEVEKKNKSADYLASAVQCTLYSTAH